MSGKRLHLSSVMTNGEAYPLQIRLSDIQHQSTYETENNEKRGKVRKRSRHKESETQSFIHIIQSEGATTSYTRGHKARRGITKKSYAY